MKKLLLFTLVAIVCTACSTNEAQNSASQIPAAPNELYVSFDEEDTRIQLGDDGRPGWTAGDLVSVFYRSNSNDKYQFTGETGDHDGSIQLVEQGTTTQATTKIVAVYPYHENYWLNCESGYVEAFLPAEQTYVQASYGVGSSIMVSASDYKQLSFKNVCGWLKLQFTGKGNVSKITLRGNNGEQIIGKIYIKPQDATCVLVSNMDELNKEESSDPDSFATNCENLHRVVGEWDEYEIDDIPVVDDTPLTEVVLNCGKSVALNIEKPTSFYIALPPQIFEKGFTVTIYDDYDSTLNVSTENRITIKRNHILPMASIDIETPTSNNQMDYTDGGTMW